MPTPPKRWPNNAAKARDETDDLARNMQHLCNEAIDHIRQNRPLEAQLTIVYVMKDLERIRRLMTGARNGNDE